MRHRCPKCKRLLKWNRKHICKTAPQDENIRDTPVGRYKSKHWTTPPEDK